MIKLALTNYREWGLNQWDGVIRQACQVLGRISTYGASILTQVGVGAEYVKISCREVG